LTRLTLEQACDIIEAIGPVFEKLGFAIGQLKRYKGIVARVKVNMTYGIIEIRFSPKERGTE